MENGTGKWSKLRNSEHSMQCGPFLRDWCIRSSVFLFYYPEKWQDVNHELEVHYAIPPHWSRDPVGQRQYIALAMVETSMKNPGCDYWCGVVDPVKWSGPGEEGIYITSTFEKVSFSFHCKSKNTSTDELAIQ